MNDEAGFYASPGVMTALAGEPRLMDGLPGDADGLCGVSKGLIVHEFAAEAYGVTDAAVRVEEVETRPARDIVGGIARIDPRPLAEAREPGHRMIGNCRQFTVLTCALLRRAGIPARARAGFGGYFGDGWTDHWVLERLHDGRWIRTDPQIDDVFSEMLGIDFDPLDMPEGLFLTGAEAWLRCRRGEEDPARFGIGDMHGLWFVAGNVVRDLAALNKVELLPWDVWGLMDTDVGETEDARTALLNEVATAATTRTLTERRRLYDRDGLRVPGTVRSHRFQRDVPLATA